MKPVSKKTRSSSSDDNFDLFIESSKLTNIGMLAFSNCSRTIASAIRARKRRFEQHLGVSFLALLSELFAKCGMNSTVLLSTKLVNTVCVGCGSRCLILHFPRFFSLCIAILNKYGLERLSLDSNAIFRDERIALYPRATCYS